MRTRRAFLAMAICLGAASAARAQLSETEKAAVLLGNRFSTETNIVYKVANRYEAKLDLYRPSKPAGPTPLSCRPTSWPFR